MAAYYHGNLALEEKVYPNRIVQQTSKKVIKKKNISPKEKLIYIFSILLFVIVGGILLSRVAQAYENNYQIQQIKIQMNKLEQDNNLMQLQISELSAPERIIDIAKNQLGMVPNSSQVNIVENGQAPKKEWTASK